MAAAAQELALPAVRSLRNASGTPTQLDSSKAGGATQGAAFFEDDAGMTFIFNDVACFAAFYDPEHMGPKTGFLHVGTPNLSPKARAKTLDRARN